MKLLTLRFVLVVAACASLGFTEAASANDKANQRYIDQKV